MPKFLDVPSWYDKNGKLKNMDDYSEIYNAPQTYWTATGMRTWISTQASWTEENKPLQVRITFKSSISASQAASLSEIYFGPQPVGSTYGYIYYSTVGGSPSIRCTQGLWRNSPEFILYNYLSSGGNLILSTTVSNQQPLILTSGYVYTATQNSPEMLDGILFEKIEFEVPSTPLRVDCQYLYDELQTLKSQNT